MKKFLKPGRVVIMLSGKYAGKKAVILKVNYDGTREKKFRHCIVAGMCRYPRKVHCRQSEERIKRRIRVKTFVKYVNFNHFMPTRYILSEQLDVKGLVKTFDSQANLKKEGETVEKQKDPLANIDFKADYKKQIKTMLEKKYKELDLNSTEEASQELRFLFKPLRF